MQEAEDAKKQVTKFKAEVAEHKRALMEAQKKLTQGAQGGSEPTEGGSTAMEGRRTSKRMKKGPQHKVLDVCYDSSGPYMGLPCLLLDFGDARGAATNDVEAQRMIADKNASGACACPSHVSTS